MKLLLDTHHSPKAAERLRDEGYDVTAAANDQLLATLSDEELLRSAARDGRALVTENARDFDRIVRSWAAAGEHHAGVVFTSPRRYHRGSSGYPQKLIAALHALLADPPEAGSDWVLWLP
ncbi:MAG: DUF5615 family PIN-like protein [Actinomycetota bacterium]|nr:DUF5615 family PIN-like protein [Actinomycetota bacterium]MDQ3575001.1 DUF5615 family PIN-like protein [Actinomycetota bacterium]